MKQSILDLILRRRFNYADLIVIQTSINMYKDFGAIPSLTFVIAATILIVKAEQWNGL